MTAKKESTDKAASLRIEGDMTIYRATELKETLLAALRSANSLEVLEVDLSAVTEIDSAGVQLLMLAKEEARAKPCELRLVASHSAVLEVFELLDLTDYFNDSLVMPAQAA